VAGGHGFDGREQREAAIGVDVCILDHLVVNLEDARDQPIDSILVLNRRRPLNALTFGLKRLLLAGQLDEVDEFLAEALVASSEFLLDDLEIITALANVVELVEWIHNNQRWRRRPIGARLLLLRAHQVLNYVLNEVVILLAELVFLEAGLRVRR